MQRLTNSSTPARMNEARDANAYLATKQGIQMLRGGSRRSPARWRWNQTTQISAEARLHVLSHEAVLMNSLRRMLAEVPQQEAKLGLWVGEKVPAALKANKLDSSQSHQTSSPGHGNHSDQTE